MKTYSIFETHAHYDDEAFEPDRDGLLSSLQGNGIGTVVNVCASVGELGRTITLTEKYPFVYGAVGVHPDDADKMTEQTLNEIRELSRREKILAIGEIGLTITGIRKRLRTRSRKKCSALRWILPEKKSFRL